MLSNYLALAGSLLWNILCTLWSSIRALWNKTGSADANFSVTNHDARSLPQELVDIIIDLLGGDNDLESLRVCSLICHAWVYRAQLHLHRRAFVQDNQDTHAIPTDWYSNPRVARLVLHLVLDMCLQPIGGPHLSPTNNFWAAIERFPSITRLSIRQGSWSDEQLTEGVFFSHFRGIISISLQSATFDSSSQFLSFVAGFPSLTELTIGEVVLGELNTDPILANASSAFITRSTIHCFTIADNCSSLDIFWFLPRWLGAISEGFTQAVRLTWETGFGIETLPSILRALGMSLERFRLDMYDLKNVNFFDDKGPLPCTGLRHLMFDRLVLDVFSHRQSEFAWIADFLGALDSPRLTTVTFRCILSDRNDIFALCLFEIDEVLSKDTIPTLTEVVFVLVGQSALSSSGIYNFMDMPRLKDRGVLRLEFEVASPRRVG